MSSIRAHLLFWLIYWLVFAFADSRYDDGFWRFAVGEAVTMPARIAAVYGSFWLISRFEKRPSWLIFSGLASFAVAAGYINRAVKFFWLVPHFFPESSIEFWGYRVFYDIFDAVLAMTMALSFWLFLKNRANSLRAESLRAERSAAELQALRSQIQPHFLFNTINSIYALARKQSPKTAPVALKLAHLLRFVLYETQKPEIPLATEVQVLTDYLELEQLRFDGERLKLETDFQLEKPQFPIAPLLLLPLVENAFKHGAGEQRDNAMIKISLRQTGDRLDFSVKNSLPEEKTIENPDGIGLKNVRRQLELTYPNCAGLDILRAEDFFEIKLWITN